MTMKKVDLNTTFISNWPYKKGTYIDSMGTELLAPPTAQFPKDRISNHQKYDWTVKKLKIYKKSPFYLYFDNLKFSFTYIK